MRLKENCGDRGVTLGHETVLDINMLEDLVSLTPSEILSAYIGFLRAYHLWMHGAHNVAKGPSFAGDHVELYGKIYNEVQDAIDLVIEKGIGVYQDEGIACPMKIAEDVLVVFSDWESPSNLPAERIAALALEYTRSLVQIGEGTSKTLEDMEVLTYGMDNLLAGLVDTHESYVYLLQQRVK